MQEFTRGLKDSLPIVLGYVAVSFSFGILAVTQGMGIFTTSLISLTNVTSAGQFAGLSIIVAGGTIIEIIATLFIINLRYGFMSLALSQKLSPDVKLWQRFVIAFVNTDEVFAVAMQKMKSVTFKYMVGLEILPLIGWTAGTFLGAYAGNILPASVCTALGIALYGMFIAIVVPVAKKSKSVMIVVFIAIGISTVLYYVPGLNEISAGISIIISTIVASVIGAIFFPVYKKKGEAETEATETKMDKGGM